MSDIEDRVKKTIQENLQCDMEKIVPGADLMDDLNADSLDKVEIMMAMEEEFNIEIPDKQAEEVETVGQCIDYIKRRVEAAA